MTAARALTLVIVAAALLFVLADVVALPRSTIEIAPATPVQFLKTIGALMVIAIAARVVRRRMEAKPALIAAFLRRAADGLRIIVEAGVLFTPLSLAAGIFMYTAAATSRPLRDPQLAAVDHLLGFDWPSFLAATNAHAVVATVLSVAYHTTGPQIPVVFFVLAMTLRRERLLEYLALIAVTSVLTGALMALVPAAGAYELFQPPRAAFSHFTASAGMWHYEELMRLRSGNPFLYDVTRTQGLVTFPSYHAVLAIITSYAVRGVRYVALPVAILNAVVVVSTIPEGGHHLIDVLVGAVLALVSIAFVRGIARPASAPPGDG